MTPDLVEAILVATAGEPEKRAQTVRSTFARIEAGERVESWGALFRLGTIPRSVLIAARRWFGGDAKPRIAITTNFDGMADQALDAIAAFGQENAERALYQSGSLLVRVHRDTKPPPRSTREPGTPVLSIAPASEIRALAASGADWYQMVETKAGGETFKKTVPLDKVIETIQGRITWPQIDPLELVTEAPILLGDGSVLQTPGYDIESGVLYEPNATYPSVPSNPTSEDIARAVALLNDAVYDVKFVREEHRTGWFAAVLTMVGRLAFEGAAPMFLVGAPSEGEGKSNVAKITAIIATGREPASFGFTVDTTEMDKRITGFVASGARAVFLDNIEGVLGGAPLERALTESIWGGRILGQSKEFRGPQRAVFLGSANNCEIAPGGMARRLVHIRINSGHPSPRDRGGFRHDPWLPWVKANRPELVVAALTILRGYIAAGKPPQVLQRWGSYEEWAKLVIAALVYAGLPDPGAARDDATAADREEEYRVLFIRTWAEIVTTEQRADPATQGMTAKRGLERLVMSGGANEAMLALLAVKQNQVVTPVLLSGLLRRLSGRHVPTEYERYTCAIVAFPKRRDNVVRWGVEWKQEEIPVDTSQGAG